MKTIILALAGVLALAPLARAHDFTVGSIHIVHPWARATPKGATVGGGYMTITNNGTEPDRLIGGSSEVAGRFEIHEMTMDNGVMKMRPLKDGIEIKPGETVKLEPGGYHVMMFDLKKPMADKDHVKGTLEFAKAGKVGIYYLVVPVGATPHGEGGGTGQMEHMDHMSH